MSSLKTDLSTTRGDTLMSQVFQATSPTHNTNPKDLLNAEIGETFKIALRKKEGNRNYSGYIMLEVILVDGSPAVKVTDSTFEPIQLQDYHRLHLWISHLKFKKFHHARGQKGQLLSELFNALLWATSSDYIPPQTPKNREPHLRLVVPQPRPAAIQLGEEKVVPITEDFVFGKLKPNQFILGSGKVAGRNYVLLRKHNDGYGVMMTLVRTDIECLAGLINTKDGEVSMSDIRNNKGQFGGWLYDMLPLIGKFKWRT